jgi:hypothetical protein
MTDIPLLDAAPPHAVGFRLPVGYTDAQGRTHHDAALRKLRGSDEALLYDADLSGTDLVSRLLQGCLVRLGPFGPVEPALIDQLTSADRNYLLFELRRITFGDAWRAVYVCPGCATVVQRLEDLATFAVRRLGDGEAAPEVVVELEDGYQDRTGAAHRRVVARLPRGDDEAFVARLAESDFLQARDALLVRCIRQFGSLSRAALEGYGVKILRELTLGDRQRLQRAFETTPGVQFQRPVSCPGCGLQFETVADVTDFFGLS